MRAFLLATTLAIATGWSRLDVGGKTPPITCGGAVMSEAIKKNIRGENPKVPVSIIARYPLLDPFVKFLSDFHVYCALAVMVLVWIQFLLPKGTVKAWARTHVYIGRLLAWGMGPHFTFVGLTLNYYAIMLDVTDWKLAPPASDWRLQVSYIIPFAMNNFLSFTTGFFLMKHGIMPQWTATPLKYIALFSVTFWFTVGIYQTGMQGFGLGLGNFGMPVNTSVPGGTLDGQDFFTPVNFIVFFVGTMQAGQDFIFYKILCVVEKSGLQDISWKDMHKYAMINLAYQGGVILALFVAFFPFCLFGLPEWTCLTSPFFAAPIIGAGVMPVYFHVGWTVKFIKAICGPPEAIAAFSKPTHKWDGAPLATLKAE